MIVVKKGNRSEKLELLMQFNLLKELLSIL